MKSKPTLFTAIIVVTVWLAITIIGGNRQGGGQQSLDELVSHGPLWGVWTALAFLAVVTVMFRWSGIGFTRPDWKRSLKLMWLPGLLVALMLGGACAGTIPPPMVLFWVLVNTLLVGVSEEWAFRGVLLKSLRDRFPLLAAISLNAVAFGLVHSLNGFVTGDFASAFNQAAAASMSGVLFVALRLRTHSLLPVMLLHGLWDFSAFSLGLSQGKTVSPGVNGAEAFFLPLLIVLPNFLYGCYLLRSGKQGEIEQASPGQ